ncbi:MAG TPA: capsule assembly Wzi family protein [Treponemataceae bacterium]|nr:capsule assembly Wzi family protein [Treponemataceae bacterium]
MIRFMNYARSMRRLTLDKTAILAFAIGLFALARPCAGFAQEALLSTAENYYEFLALSGNTERSYLNYRTLSDSVWTVKDGDGNLWNGVNLGTTRSLSDAVRFRVYGPDFFSSYNSAEPYGQNDGALWQGKGVNASITAGARLEAYGFELTLKPQIAFSQNRSFTLVNPAYSGDLYAGKADTYGYFGAPNIDAPQRFGDDPLYTFSWGDSEIRYSWKTLTVGFGTQAIWLGPAKINPILHSNNAAPYPKFDIGLRKQEIALAGHDLGDVEARLWCGYLTESDYFDTDDSNDHNMISGLSFAYAPPVLDGLTLFVNRVYLAKWEKDSFGTISHLFIINTAGGGAQDVWDQRGSFGFDYLLPLAAIEVYGEAGINDYEQNIHAYLRYPFHSMVYTAGIVKSVRLPTSYPLSLEILFEWSNLELSQDFQFQWASTFYAHHQITQGYTNEGQWLGAGNGTGGNSQYLGFKLYYPRGYTNLFIHRQNPDNDHIYVSSIHTDANTSVNIKDVKGVVSFGVNSGYQVWKNTFLSAGATWIIIENPVYEGKQFEPTDRLCGYRLETAFSWQY